MPLRKWDPGVEAGEMRAVRGGQGCVLVPAGRDGDTQDALRGARSGPRTRRREAEPASLLPRLGQVAAVKL